MGNCVLGGDFNDKIKEMFFLIKMFCTEVFLMGPPVSFVSVQFKARANAPLVTLK